MKVYVDGLLLLNFFFDFLLLLTTNIVLKKNTSLFRIILGSFVGSLSILILFFKVNNITLFFIKFYLGFLMCIISFGFKNIKTFLKTFFVFYIVSILLGGFLYYLNIEFSYKHSGLVFYNKSPSINIIFLIIFSPIILYIYIKQNKTSKYILSNTYLVNIYIGNNILKLNGFLDTGNNLTYKNKPVIITNIKNTFKGKKYNVIYQSSSGFNILSCIKVKKVEVIGLGVFRNIYLGFSDIKMDSDLLLNNLMEGYND